MASSDSGPAGMPRGGPSLERIAATRDAITRLQMMKLAAAQRLQQAPPPAPPASASRRLIVVANRLPITVTRDAATGAYDFKMSSGGLVSALMSVRDQLKFVWLGWLGKEIPQADRDMIKERLLAEYSCAPVFISDALAERYYSGFSNAELWPRFHHEYTAVGTQKFDASQWEAYLEANTAFAEETLKIAAADGDGAMIWLHDYHLMAMPAMLRQALPTANICWFLHTPWPAAEIYRMLPVGEQILRALLACDMVGFHTYDYARHFAASCALLLRARVTASSIAFGGRDVRVGVFPIGIEPQQFVDTVASPACQKRIGELCSQFAGQRVIVSVDRLDPIKGIPHRLLGLEALFRRHPEWVGRVVFLQLAIPSRADVEAYQRLWTQCNMLASRINGEYGTLAYEPVHYLYRSVDRTELSAMYSIGDICMITSLRDGMNLVSEEYVAAQTAPCPLRPAPGILLLSEFAGCAQSLAGAVHVNPWSPDDIADKLHQALTMGAEERQVRWRSLNRYVSTFTSQQWAGAFTASMLEAGNETATRLAAASTVPVATGEALRAAMVTRTTAGADALKLLVLDAGALTAPVPPAAAAAGDGTSWTEGSASIALPADVKRSLNALAANPRNIVVVVSAAGIDALDAALTECPGVCIAAEGGLLVRLPVASRIGLATPVGDATATAAATATAKSTTSIGRRTAASVLSRGRVGGRGTTAGGRGAAVSSRLPSVTEVFPSSARQVDSGTTTAATPVTSPSPRIVSLHGIRVLASPSRKLTTPRSSTFFGSAAQSKASVVARISPASNTATSSSSSSSSPLTWTVDSCAWSALASEVTGADERPLSKLAAAGCRLVGDDGVPSTGMSAPTTTAAAPTTSVQELTATDASLSAWKLLMLPAMMRAYENTPGSRLVETHNTLTWVCDECDPDQCIWEGKELQVQLESTLASAPLDVHVRPSSIEVRLRVAQSPLALALLHCIDSRQVAMEASGMSTAFPSACICAMAEEDEMELVAAAQTLLDTTSDGSTALVALSVAAGGHAAPLPVAAAQFRAPEGGAGLVGTLLAVAGV